MTLRILSMNRGREKEVRPNVKTVPSMHNLEKCTALVSSTTDNHMCQGTQEVSLTRGIPLLT